MPKPGVFARFGQLWRRLRGGELSRGRVALSVALGLLIGSTPLYGLHFFLCALLCVPLRLDLVSAYLAANISNPLFAPFLLTAEVEVGSLLLSGQHAAFDVARAREAGVGEFLLHAFVGSVVVGSALALAGGALAFRIASRRIKSPVDAAVDRTRRRYRAAHPRDRIYVAMKLELDPVLREIAGLGALGRVGDLGAGRGQLGLALLELGRVEQLIGVEWDERKVEVARAAAGGAAWFQVGDLREYEPPVADTLLLIDVLHYFSQAEQDRVLEVAARALAAGGRLIVREVDADERGLRGAITRGAERLAARIGYNRASRISFRSRRELCVRLEQLDLKVEIENESGAGSNTLIVARREISP